MAAPSSLVLGLHLCQSTNCKVLRLSETTGAYNGATNTGGWGAPNPATTDATTVTLSITDPAGSVYTLLTPQLTAESWPDDTGTEELLFISNSSGMVLDPTAAGQNAFADGFYTVTYTVDGSYLLNNVATLFTNTITQNFLITCQIRCCIDKMFHLATQTSDCIDCKSTALAKALEADAYLKSAEFAAACGKTEMAKKHLAKAQWLCNTKNCSNC